MLEQDVSERLLSLISELGLNQSQFAKKMGLSPSSITNITGERRSRPSFVILEKIAKHFPSVNMNWFLTGVGSIMLKDESEGESEIKDKYISAMEKLTKVQEENKELLNEILQLKTAQ